MSKRDYTSNRDNFLKHILELRTLISRILHSRECLRVDFENLQSVINDLSKESIAQQMQYKGYIGHIEYDDKAKIFHGQIVGLKDVITFQGSSVEELEEAFRDSVEDYLAWV